MKLTSTKTAPRRRLFATFVAFYSAIIVSTRDLFRFPKRVPQFGSNQLAIAFLIFLFTHAKQPEDHLSDFAGEQEEQGNAEGKSPLLSGQCDRIEYPLQDP